MHANAHCAASYEASSNCYLKYIVCIIFIYIFINVIHEVNFSITNFIVSIFFI